MGIRTAEALHRAPGPGTSPGGGESSGRADLAS